MEKTIENKVDLIELKEKIRIAKSLLFILEGDSSLESANAVYFDAIKVIHSMVKEVYEEFDKLSY